MLGGIMSIRLARFLLITLLAQALISVSIYGEDAKKEVSNDYVGVKKCKTCHKDKYTAWLETKHANTFSLLSVEEQKKPECIKCHTTGTTIKGVVLEGTQCEACHGPGSKYKSPKIMSKKKWKADPEGHKKLALDAGLVMPTEKTCKKCHTKEGNTNFKGFDFATAKNKVHPIPEASEAKK